MLVLCKHCKYGMAESTYLYLEDEVLGACDILEGHRNYYRGSLEAVAV